MISQFLPDNGSSPLSSNPEKKKPHTSILATLGKQEIDSRKRKISISDVKFTAQNLHKVRLARNEELRKEF